MSRTAAASRADVVDAAARRFRHGERIDVAAVAAQAGVARATAHRWFGTREGLIGEAIVAASERTFAVARERAADDGVVAALGWVTETLATDRGLRTFLENERDAALRILTSSAGLVQPAWVERTQALLEEAVARGQLRLAADAPTLAYATIRLVEAFLYNDAAAGLRGDADRLRVVLAALLR